MTFRDRSPDLGFRYMALVVPVDEEGASKTALRHRFTYTSRPSGLPNGTGSAA